ncbi:MAG: hypothetical protein U0K87_13035 [Ruminococcus sp.]|nr:hypothetical protein [Ruminococcus sp.]
MRDKIIKRFAAGTIGVCFAYALIRQPFAVMKNPSELMTADWSAATQSTTQIATVPTTIYPVTTVPETLPDELPTEIIETYPATEQPETEAVTEPLKEKIIEDSEIPENESDEELLPQQNESGGDVPTLSQFLSTMICGGCRHNCSLVSPRCMKGRAKAESATVEYYETYGA